MERVTIALLCLAVPAVFAGLLVLGHCIFTSLLRTVSSLEVWANEQIRQIEDWQEEEE